MRNRVMIALVAAFSLGAGVMGTLAWVESRSPAKSATVASTSTETTPPIDNMAAADALARAKAAQAAAGTPGDASMGSVPPGVAPGGAAPAGAAPEGAGAIEQPPAELTQGANTPAAKLQLANWYYDHERWPQAVELYRATLAGGIDNPDVRTDLGNALRFNGEPRQALTQYQIAQQQDPKHENSLFNQGGLYAFALNEPNKAVVAWKEYLKKFPKGRSTAQVRQFIKEHSGAKAKKN